MNSVTRTTIVPVSGGKDSQVVLSLALKAGVKNIVCVHQSTGYDHPDTYRHLEWMKLFYGVEIEFTSSKYGNMFGLLDSVGYSPNSAARGCTQRLKQEPFAEWLVTKGFNAENSVIWFGMRADESATRDAKYGHLNPNDEMFTLADIAQFYGASKARQNSIGKIPVRLPIVDWNTADVFEYLSKNGEPINELYEKGHHRVGCYPCLLSRKSEWVAAANDPVGRSHLQQLLEREDRWAMFGNKRKFIKVHRVWDVREFLKGGDVRELSNEECGYCSI